LPLFVELSLLSRNLVAQLGDVVRLGGTLRQAQHWEQQCQRQE
jgi:hypothetical protein